MCLDVISSRKRNSDGATPTLKPNCVDYTMNSEIFKVVLNEMKYEQKFTELEPPTSFNKIGQC